MSDSFDVEQLSPASIWILEKYVNLEKVLDERLEDYELAHSVDALYKFLWDYFADWYVEYLKTDESQLGFAKQLFRQYIITLSPYMPFETEALWEKFFKEKQILAFEAKDSNWAKNLLAKLNQENQSNEFENVVDFVENFRSLRGLFAIDPGNLIEVYTQDSILLKYTNFVRLLCKAELVNEQKPDLFAVKTQNYQYNLDILSYIKDKQAEIQRTNKLITDLEKQISQLEAQLSNQKFLDNADPEIIEEKKQDLSSRKIELKQQQNKLEWLN